MIFEINDVVVMPGAGPAFEAAFAEARKLLLCVPGCRSARLLGRLGEPGRYQVQVGWDRLEDHVEVYPGTAEAGEIRALLGPLIATIDRSHCRDVPFG